MRDLADLSDLGRETALLLQQLIRNACVNDGTADSGHEVRQTDVLREFFAEAGVDCEVVEPHPGRASLIVHVPGADPSADAVCLLGHTDVVPVEAGGWDRDPFGGDIVDGVMWGRGAIDMLNLTATYAVVVRTIARTGARLRGDLVFAAVADEEAGGALGAEWLLEHRPDLVRADVVLTEAGGAPVGSLPRIGVMIGEKGRAHRTLRVTGTPGHGSAPWGAQNAAVLAAEAIRRLAAYRGPTTISPQWREHVSALGLDEPTSAALTDPARLVDTLPVTGSLAGYAHACAHTTISPNIIRAGDKLNVIPGIATIDLDVRVLPGVTPKDVEGYLREALGDLIEHVDISGGVFEEASVSPTTTAMYQTLRRAAKLARPSAELLPMVAAGGTDGRFFRLRGVPAYGFGVLSDRWDYGAFRTLFHGHNERIDLESLELTAQAINFVVREYLR